LVHVVTGVFKLFFKSQMEIEGKETIGKYDLCGKDKSSNERTKIGD